MFQQMMKDAKAKKFNTIICYRLDRISRNIADFSQMVDTFSGLGIDFVSIREQFDTSTPMGRAMMMIASVFAQLERETIAERIKDNMLQLSKTGRWLGGNTPTGYKSESIEVTDRHGAVKKAYKLIPAENEIELVKLLYDKYIELDSLRKLETYCVQSNITSKNNNSLSRFALTNILTNPVYVKADKEVYEYLTENDYEIYSSEEEFNGINGIMTYNKTNCTTKKNKARDTSEWIMAIGAHEGCIPSAKWLRVQKTFERNRSKGFRKVRNSECLLSGLIRCGQCGSPMRPKAGRTKSNGEATFVYMCETKEVSKKAKCSAKNINGKLLDNTVIDEIKKIASNKSGFGKELRANIALIDETRGNPAHEIKRLEEKTAGNTEAISNLVDSLTQYKESAAGKHIISRIEALEQENNSMKEKLLSLKEELSSSQTDEANLDTVRRTLSSLTYLIDSASVVEKRDLLRTIIEKITWDGENISIALFGSANQEEEIIELLPSGDACR